MESEITKWVRASAGARRNCSGIDKCSELLMPQSLIKLNENETASLNVGEGSNS